MATIEITEGIEYPFGAEILLSMTVKQNGSLIDPSGEITLILEEPDGTGTVNIYNGGAGAVQKSGTGAFNLPVLTDQVGIHEYRWKTVGPVGVKESYFVVIASRVANP